MRDHLLDIVKNTYGLGIIDLVKVSGTDSETTIEALAEDRSVIVQAKLNGPVMSGEVWDVGVSSGNGPMDRQLPHCLWHEPRNQPPTVFVASTNYTP